MRLHRTKDATSDPAVVGHKVNLIDAKRTQCSNHSGCHTHFLRSRKQGCAGNQSPDITTGCGIGDDADKNLSSVLHMFGGKLAVPWWKGQSIREETCAAVPGLLVE